MTVGQCKPRLLVLASTYPRWRDDHEPGFVHELCKRLASHFQVTALVSDAPGADPDGMLDGVEVIRFRYAPRRMQTLVYDGGIATNLRRSRWKWLLVPCFVLGQWRAARRVVRERNVDVVHAHWLVPQGWVARYLWRRHGIPYLVTSHGGDLFGLRGTLPTWLKRKVAASSAAMTVVSEAMREEARRIRLAPPQLQVLPMGVDLQGRFVPDPGIPRNVDELLFVGRLVPKKGLRYLLDAMPRVLAERGDVTLTIAGFGPEEQALKAQATRLGIERSVRFVGPTQQSDLPALYRRASVFVAPFIRDETGNQEGLPVALMEAIGCGCPVVVGEVAGIRELLGDSVADAIVRPRDAEEVATAILATLRNPTAAADRARHIRANVVARVDWKSIASGYAALLDGIMGTAHPDSHAPVGGSNQD